MTAVSWHKEDWHLVEQRMRDARRGATKDGQHVEEES